MTDIERITIPVYEQETVISIERDSKTAEIYTTDTTWINKLERLAAVENTEIAIKYEDGFGITAILPKDLITVRAKRTKRNMTPEQKQAAGDRLRKARENL